MTEVSSQTTETTGDAAKKAEAAVVQASDGTLGRDALAAPLPAGTQADAQAREDAKAKEEADAREAAAAEVKAALQAEAEAKEGAAKKAAVDLEQVEADRKRQAQIDEAREAERLEGHAAGAAPTATVPVAARAPSATVPPAHPPVDAMTQAEVLAHVVKGEIAVLKAAGTFAEEVRKAKVMGAAGEKAALALQSSTFQLGALLSELLKQIEPPVPAPAADSEKA